MRDPIILLVHLIATLARLMGPGGLRSVVAESVLVKQQLLILNRSRHRAPNLCASDRILAGVCALFMRPARVIRSAIVLRPSARCRELSVAGVGLGEDLIFVGLRSAEVAALRQDTGALVWAEPVGSIPAQHGETVTTAPMYAGGKVFVGLANGDAGGQGRIIALDAKTGEKAWTFFIVPRPGEFGHDTWPQDSDIWKLGGGGVWLNGTVDPELGLVYFATGNPAPMFGGELRAPGTTRCRPSLR